MTTKIPHDIRKNSDCNKRCIYMSSNSYHHLDRAWISLESKHDGTFELTVEHPDARTKRVSVFGHREVAVPQFKAEVEAHIADGFVARRIEDFQRPEKTDDPLNVNYKNSNLVIESFKSKTPFRCFHVDDIVYKRIDGQPISAADLVNLQHFKMGQTHLVKMKQDDPFRVLVHVECDTSD